MGRRVIINGRELSEEEIAQMEAQQAEQQREQLKQYWAEWDRLRAEYDCNCAIVLDNLQQIVCSIDKHLISNVNECKKCNAYNNTDYSKIE